MVKKNACVFISGKGSNLKNLIFKSRDYNFPINIKLVISNKKSAYGLSYAKRNSIPYFVVDTNFNNYENKILMTLRKYKINFICLAGFMKIIPKKIIKQYRMKILNIHPSLLPKFKGLNTFKRILEKKEKKTGCTVHYVNSKLDGGKIILKKSFFIENNENEISLKRKTQKMEYIAFPEAIIKVFSNA